MTPDLFTIVMTVHKREHFLPYALQSLIWQTYQKLEVLLYSDGPSERARAIVGSVTQHPALKNRLEYIECLPRPGYFGNHLREEGLRRARGGFISFLSHDTFYHPEFCQRHAGRLLLQPCISITKTDYWEQRPNAVESQYRLVLPSQPPELAVRGTIDAHCIAYPTDLLRRYASFADVLDRHAADYELFNQMRSHLPIVYNADDPRTFSAHM